MSIQKILNQLLAGQSLSSDAMGWVMRSILSGSLDDIQIAGFLVALRAKGESVIEIQTAIEVMREKMTRVDIQVANAVDIVGTGGDQQGLFNVSTAAAIVASAAGVIIAKHGNRSVSSRSGAADVLTSFGVALDLDAQQVATCINQIGIGFMFAPNHHNAMRFVMAARKSLGIRTLFNLLGPLCNPASVKRQVIGVYDKQWLMPMAEALKELGSEHILLVHSADGLDEISIASSTQVVELKDSEITSYQIDPADFGIEPQSLELLKVTDSEQSRQLIETALEDDSHPAASIIALNAAAAIYVSGLSSSLQQGVDRAMATLKSHKPRQKIAELVELSQQLRKV